MLVRRLWIVVVLLASGLIVLQGSAPGASYPTKPVTLVVPFAAGGAVDQIARALAESVKISFPQPISVVQRPGGAGTIGCTQVLQASADGHTIGITGPTQLLLMPQQQDLPYKTTSDFTPIATASEFSSVIAVRAEAPWRTLQEVLQAAQQRPGELRVGNGGLGSLPHLNIEIVRDKAGVRWTTVPFPSGDPEGIAAILGGHVDVYVSTFPPAAPQARAGKLRLLAYFGDARHPLTSDVPTARELGYDVALTSYIYIFGPKGMPESVVNALSDALKKGTETDAFKKLIQGQGSVVRYQGPAELKSRMEKDYHLFGEMIKKLNLKAGS